MEFAVEPAVCPHRNPMRAALYTAGSPQAPNFRPTAVSRSLRPPHRGPEEHSPPAQSLPRPCWRPARPTSRLLARQAPTARRLAVFDTTLVVPAGCVPETCHDRPVRNLIQKSIRVMRTTRQEPAPRPMPTQPSWRARSRLRRFRLVAYRVTATFAHPIAIALSAFSVAK